MLDTPLLLDPVLVDKPWGGDRLGRLGRAVGDGARVGESWDVADLGADQTPVGDPVSRVRVGPAAGRTLAELIAEHPVELLGTVTPTDAGRFPLLVKLLDARESLSVQVHPPSSLSPDGSKTESWVVLDSAPGSRLTLGVRDGVTLDEVRAAMGTAELLPLLRQVPVGAGDVVHLPAGTIHALGAGVLVAEVQTTSDTTYRVWDWPEGRHGGRELHVDRAREAVAAGWEHNLDVTVDRSTDGVIVDCAPYRLEQATVAATAPLAAAGRSGAARVVIVTAGSLRWTSGDPDGHDHDLPAGGVTVLPAACSRPVVAGPDGATALVATPR